MGVFLTALSFMSAISLTANDMPTQYEYKANCVAQDLIYIGCPDIIPYNASYPMYAEAYVYFSCDLYFNSDDYNSYYFKNIEFDCFVDVYQYSYQTQQFSQLINTTYYDYSLPYDIGFDSWGRFAIGFEIDFAFEYPRITAYSFDGDVVGTSTGQGIPGDSGYSVKTVFNANNFANEVNTFILSQSYGGAYNTGYQTGYTEGLQSGNTEGYQIGYTAGYTEASNQDQTAVAIFTGICEVGLLPVNVFLGILNFEVFGINIGALMASLMTVAIVVIVIRVVLGAKGGGKGD